MPQRSVEEIHRRTGGINMALKRETLAAMGIEPDKINEIIRMHAETVEALKEQRDGYKSEAEKAQKDIEGYKQTAADATKELAELKEAQGKDAPYKDKYEELKQEYESYKTGIEEKEAKGKVSEAYKAILKEAKIADKYIPVIMKATDLSEMKLDENGNLEGAKEAKEKAASEWAEFVEKTSAKGTNTSNPPKNTGGSDMTVEEIDAIKDTAERQKAMYEHRDLYGL